LQELRLRFNECREILDRRLGELLSEFLAGDREKT
jgi:hypothetical protein